MSRRAARSRRPCDARSKPAAGPPAKPRGLRVTRRKDREGLWIVGTPYPGGERIRRRAASDDPALAREEAAALHAELLRGRWHGERRGARSFAEAVLSYLAAAPRSTGDKRRLNRILVALGDVTLGQVDQAAIDRVRRTVLGTAASPATVKRGVVTPIRAVLRHAQRRGWCDAPAFEIPKEAEGRTAYLLPAEAERLYAAAAPHLKPLLVFLLSTGARLAEALELEWRDLDLVGARAIFWKTKGGRRRVAALCPRAVAELAGLAHREGPVFRWETRRPATTTKRQGRPKRIQAYADRKREGGGQIKNAFAGALRRAGLVGFTPHDLRHSWASWHYAVNRDLLALKVEGGWSSASQVERYAHLMPAGQEAKILAFWGMTGTAARPDIAEQQAIA
jgi:integrase